MVVRLPDVRAMDPSWQEHSTARVYAPWQDGRLWSASRALGGAMGSMIGEDAGTGGVWGIELADDGGVKSGVRYSGIVKNNSGNPVAGATVTSFLASNAGVAVAASSVSDSAGGFVAVSPFPVVNHYLVAYKPGSPDVAGTTKNNIVFT